MADFSAELTGEYSLVRTSANEICISPQTRGYGTPIIPTKVIECAVDRHYILAKRQGLKDDEPDPAVFDYWILNTSLPDVIGPMTLEEFSAKRKALGIANSVVLKDVYSYRHQGMRDGFLDARPAPDETDNSKILAVVMDTGYAEATVTLGVSVYGFASLCDSDGNMSFIGPVLGEPPPEQVAATQALFTEAAKHVSEKTATKDTPMATPGVTTFYLVTGKGAFAVSAKEADFAEGRHAASPLFQKARELFAVTHQESFFSRYKQQKMTPALDR